MNNKLFLVGIAATALFSQISLAQVPVGSTGQCKDGSFTSAANKQGACQGHQGVKTWYPTPAMPASGVTSNKPSAAIQTPVQGNAAVAAEKKKGPAEEASSRTQAAGGGPGLVWVNTSSKVYHCPGTTFYGKTKAGKYMSEADAKAAGAHADHNKPCTR